MTTRKALIARKTVGLTLIAALCAGTHLASGDTLANGISSTGVVTNHVPAGTTRTETRALDVIDGQTMLKTGGGTLVLPESAPASGNLHDVTVQEGKLVLVDDAATPPEADELPASLKAKISIWLSASGSSMAKEGNAVETWYDVRETSTSSPSYPYAVAEHWDGAAAPVLTDGDCVSYRGNVTNTMRCLYFNGYGSGTAMAVKKASGDAFTDCPYEWFAVQGVNSSWGNVFGWASARGSEMPPIAGIQMSSEAGTLSSGIGFHSSFGPMKGDTALWIDGRRVDMASPMEKGFHLLDMRRNSFAENSAAFTSRGLGFYTYSSESGDAATSTRYKGGDYLSEVIGVRVPISEHERTLITSYLMRKWFGGRKAPKSIIAAAGTSVELSVPAGETAAFDATVRGEGDFSKAGAGTLVYASSDRDGADASPLSVSSGDVKMLGAATLSLVSGSRISATKAAPGASSYSTNAVTVAQDAGSGMIVKEGGLSVAIGDVPQGTERINVSAGTLAIRPSIPTTRNGVRFEVPIANGSFEDWPASIDGITARINLASVAGFSGWACSGNAQLFDFEAWPGNPGSVSIVNYQLTHATNNLPDGVRAIGLKMVNSFIYQTVTIPEDGEYELSAWISGRDLDNNRSAFAKAYLAENTSAAAPVVDFGVFTYGRNEWMRQAIRAQVRAGTYRLCLKQCANPYETDTMVLFDDIRLLNVGPYKTEWKIPYGDFEGCTNGLRRWACAWTANDFDKPDCTLPGWTFDSTMYNNYVANGRIWASAVAMSSRGGGSGFNGSRQPLGGLHQLLFRKPSRVSTTFTPPAGVWFLRCFAGDWRNTADGRLTATVEIDGVDKNLGTYAIPADMAMHRHVWAMPFETTGSQTVTLKLDYALSDGSTAEQGCHVDDIMLTAEYENENELLSNPGFENGLWTTISRSEPSGDHNIPYQRQYGGASEVNYYGASHGAGDYFAELWSDTGIMQDVDLPYSGWYRLRFLAKARLSGNSARVTISKVQNGVTNVVGTVEGLSCGTFADHAFDFRAEAGTCRLVVRSGAQGANLANSTDIDDFSLKYVGSSKHLAAALPTNIKISVASGAALALEFDGTNKVSSFRASGRAYSGIVDRTACRQLLGDGVLEVVPDGMVITFR